MHLQFPDSKISLNKVPILGVQVLFHLKELIMRIGIITNTNLHQMQLFKEDTGQQKQQRRKQSISSSCMKKQGRQRQLEERRRKRKKKRGGGKKKLKGRLGLKREVKKL